MHRKRKNFESKAVSAGIHNYLSVKVVSLFRTICIPLCAVANLLRLVVLSIYQGQLLILVRKAYRSRVLILALILAGSGLLVLLRTPRYIRKNAIQYEIFSKRQLPDVLPREEPSSEKFDGWSQDTLQLSGAAVKANAKADDTSAPSLSRRATTVTKVERTTTPCYQPKRRWRIAICAMVRDEIPYLFEWIEFHRLQGVDHFILYDDESSDDIYNLPPLYESHGLPDLVEVFPANFRRNNRPSNHASAHYLGSQKSSMHHCNQRLLNQTNFLMAIDVDEYMFSTRYKTVWDYLRTRLHLTHPKNVSEKFVSNFYVTSVRFGTSNATEVYEGSIRTDWKTGELDATVNRLNATLPLVTLANPARAPHPDLDKDFQKYYEKTCANRVDGGAACTHANGKSVWIPERCYLAGIHWCENHSGSSISPGIADLRVNHYAIRSSGHTNKLSPWLKPWKTKLLGQLDAEWFSSRKDESISKFIPDLRLELEKLMTTGGDTQRSLLSQGKADPAERLSS